MLNPQGNGEEGDNHFQFTASRTKVAEQFFSQARNAHCDLFTHAKPKTINVAAELKPLPKARLCEVA